jgi:hypothetical protein
MLAFKGYFEGGKFVAENPDTAIIPEHSLVMITMLNDIMPKVDQKNAWQNFFNIIDSSDEEIPREFPRLRFDHKVEL